MAIFYYEIPNYPEDTKQYTCSSLPMLHSLGMTGAERYRASIADRIWCEGASGEVKFVKNRYMPDGTPVDLAEFFWIKLQAQPK